jgi:hypothetical protein
VAQYTTRLAEDEVVISRRDTDRATLKQKFG